MDANVGYEDIRVTSNLKVDRYVRAIQKMRQGLAAAYTRGCPELLPVNDLYPRWFDIRLHLSVTSRATVRLRRDTLDVRGFRVNDTSAWYELGSEHLIASNSSLLGFTADYADLLRAAGYESITQVTVGLQSLIEAAGSLAFSNSSGQSRARALLVVMMMFSEVARLTGIQDYVTGNFGGSRNVKKWMMELVDGWRGYSNQVLYYDAHPEVGWEPQQVPVGEDENGKTVMETAATADEMLRYIGIMMRNLSSLGAAAEPSGALVAKGAAAIEHNGLVLVL